MSKGNMLLGHARGKVGDLVFSRTNGQQVVRARAAVVKNPQTEKQMIQRILLNTVAQAYSRMSSITDHSFEGIPQGQKSMSYFMSKNLDALRSAIAAEIAAGGDFDGVYAFAPINSNEYAANEYQIAKGSLPEIVTAFTGSTLATADLGGATYGEIIAALGLQRGDQLTFVTTQGVTGARTTFHYARVILDPVTEDGQSASLDTPFIVNGSINLPSPRNEGEFNSLAIADGVVSYNFAGSPVSGAAIIVSRQKTDGSWLRSNATLQVNQNAIAGWQKSLQECLDLFESGSVDTLSEQYLNNAGRGRLAAASNGGVTMYVAEVYLKEEEGSASRLVYADSANTSGDLEPVNIVSIKDGEYNGQSVVLAIDAQGNEYYIGSQNRYQRMFNRIVTVNGDSPTTCAKELGLSGDNVITLPVGSKVVSPYNNDGDDVFWAGAVPELQKIGLNQGLFLNA